MGAGAEDNDDEDNVGFFEAADRDDVVTVITRRQLAVAVAVFWAAASSAAVAWLIARELSRDVEEDFESALEVAISEKAQFARTKILHMPVVSTIYIFSLHYITPYLSLFVSRVYPLLRNVRPLLRYILRLVMPLINQVNKLWGLFQWTMHTREIRAHQQAVSRLKSFGSDVTTKTEASRALSRWAKAPVAPPGRWAKVPPVAPRRGRWWAKAPPVAPPRGPLQKTLTDALRGKKQQQ